ncbi:MAG: YchE family NAAT transporter [Syntrophobacteraceae bacterium]|nr:YchE family NAAT transporter [Syntrophobacteraceae bacterium]
MFAGTEYLKIFTALLVIVNPIGALPIFVTLTSHQSERERRRTAVVSAVSTGVVLIVACLLGDSLLQFFGISVASFRVGGGILILLMAIAMFHAQPSASKQTPEEAAEAGEKADVAVVPLAIPLLSGPGAISTVIIYAHQMPDWKHGALLVALCPLIAFIVWLTLRLAVPIGNALGRTGINIVTRLMGLILAAIAIEVIASGVAVLLPGLVGR